MKKFFLMLAAIAALAVSCQLVDVNGTDQTQDGSYKFDFTIAPGGFEATKGDATVGWTVGEKVFVFFRPAGGELISGGYVEFAYKEDGSWDSVSTLPDGSLGSAGKMAAVYVPYLASDVNPVFADSKWTINGGDVYYSCASGADYTVKDGTVRGKLQMAIPDGYVQFAVPYTTAGDGATMTCNLVDAYNCVELGADMAFGATPSGVAMKGHKDANGNVYFWGKKNSSADATCEITLATASGNLVKAAAADAIAGNKSFNITGLVDNALPGVFSVSGTKQVRFSKGNLQATYNGTGYDWGFAANQYDFVGDAAGNTTIDNQTSGAVVDLFGWSTAATTYGISTSTSSSDYSGDFVDWGKSIGNGSTWRTLSKDEWVYLFETRTDATSLYKCGVTICDKTNCVIIAPDGFTGTIETSYDATTWPAAEAAGLVCLPAAGSRYGSDVLAAGSSGFYWSSSTDGSDNAPHLVSCRSSNVGPADFVTRECAQSVRLITDVAGSAPEEPVIDPLSGKFSVSASKQVQFSKGNLVATIDAAGTPTAWKFAANQYDYLGEGGANKTIGSAAGDVDLFGWSTAATTYGISTSTSESDYSGDFVDWGNNIGNGSTWRTLSKDEWVYLFETRTDASGLYKYGVTVCGKTSCLIIAPDDWDTSANPLQISYDATAWATAEAAGLVCLPAAGHRHGSDVYGVGDHGDYWSSSASGEYRTYDAYFDSNSVSPDDNDPRIIGFSVRLITDVPESL